MVRRIDIGSLAKPTFREDGTVLADAVISRTGIFTYRNSDGTERRELRRDADVFNPTSLASFRGVPLTNDHPPEMINSQNAKQYSVGAVLDAPRRDGTNMVTTIAVHDAKTIADMKSGKIQVSNGYDCDLIEAPGEFNGEHYDAIQTNIVGNHVAIVHSARAGKEAAIRMDAAYTDDDLTSKARDKIPAHEFAAGDKLPIEDAAHVRAAMSRFGQTQFKDAAEKKSAYHKIVAKAKALGIDSSGFEKAWSGRLDNSVSKEDFMDLTQALAALAAANEKIGALAARCDTAEKALATAQKSADESKARADAATEELVKAKKAHADAITEAPAKVRARMALELKASSMLGKEFKMDSVDDKAIKLAVIKHVTNADCSDKSEAYIDARYDAALEVASESAETFRKANDVIESSRSDGEVDKADKARADMLARQRAAFVKPGAKV